MWAALGLEFLHIFKYYIHFAFYIDGIAVILYLVLNFDIIHIFLDKFGEGRTGK